MNTTLEPLVDQIRLIRNHFLIPNRIVQNRSYTEYTHEVDKALAEGYKVGTELPIRFVIFTFPRSGSNLLCSMLNFHPEIICHHELFNPTRIYYSKDFHELYGSSEVISRKDLTSGKKGISTIRERNLFPESFIVKVWQYNFSFNAVGFNLFPSHIPNAAMSLIKDKNVKKILLLRHDKIKCYVSRLIAQKTGTWDLYNRFRDTSENALITVNPNRLLNWSRKYDQYFYSLRQNLIKSEQNFMVLTYEDLISDKSKSIKSSLLEFIGVSVHPNYLQSPLAKQNSNSLANLVSNFNELEEKLLGTELEPLLYK